LKHLIHITCKKATYLISKKEEHRLSLMEWVKLQFHLSICSLCKLFQKQTNLMSENAKHSHDYQQLKLSDATKAKIIDQMKD
jgi:hypothetical protein